MSIVLNAKQQEAVGMAQWASQQRGKVAVLAGPAGCGKTASLKRICETLPGSTILAPTGRAALRATELTGHQAQTIHRWMYKPNIDEKTGEIKEWSLRSFNEIELPASNLIIIDEASMIPRNLWEDIYRLASAAGISILLVGDNFQLPPVSVEDDQFSVFSDTFTHDMRVNLTEVFRQALDSPVIRVATEVRNAINWRTAKLAISEFVADADNGVRQAARDAVALIKAGQDVSLISYTNATRHDVNRKVRMELQIDPDTDATSGEPLLIRKNSYHAGVFNGQIVDFSGFSEEFTFKGHRFGRTTINNASCVVSKAELLGNSIPSYDVVRFLGRQYVSANLGYCLTCHAGQGSEWDNVIFVFERKLMGMEEIMRIRFVYTAITRARKQVTIYTLNN